MSFNSYKHCCLYKKKLHWTHNLANYCFKLFFWIKISIIPTLVISARYIKFFSECPVPLFFSFKAPSHCFRNSSANASASLSVTSSTRTLRGDFRFKRGGFGGEVLWTSGLLFSSCDSLKSSSTKNQLDHFCVILSTIGIKINFVLKQTGRNTSVRYKTEL